jgi:hypothetical protein
MAGALRKVTRPGIVLRQAVSEPLSMVEGYDLIILPMHDEDRAADRPHCMFVVEEIPASKHAGGLAATSRRAVKNLDSG